MRSTGMSRPAEHLPLCPAHPTPNGGANSVMPMGRMITSVVHLVHAHRRPGYQPTSP
jgi:hypothetical protein